MKDVHGLQRFQRFQRFPSSKSKQEGKKMEGLIKLING